MRGCTEIWTVGLAGLVSYLYFFQIVVSSTLYIVHCTLHIVYCTLIIGCILPVCLSADATRESRLGNVTHPILGGNVVCSTPLRGSPTTESTTQRRHSPDVSDRSHLTLEDEGLNLDDPNRPGSLNFHDVTTCDTDSRCLPLTFSSPSPHLPSQVHTHSRP